MISIKKLEALQNRLKAYELALEWIQGTEYDLLNSQYKSMSFNIDKDDLGLCHYFWFEGYKSVYTQFEFIFPELWKHRAIKNVQYYLAENKEQRVNMLFEAIGDVQQQIYKAIEL